VYVKSILKDVWDFQYTEISSVSIELSIYQPSIFSQLGIYECVQNYNSDLGFGMLKIAMKLEMTMTVTETVSSLAISGFIQDNPHRFLTFLLKNVHLV